MNQALFSELTELFASALPEVDAAQLTPDTSFRADLGMDSVSVLMLAVKIENYYGIRFDSVTPMGTFGALTDALEHKLSTAAEPVQPRHITEPITDAPELLLPGNVFTAKLIHIVTSGLLLLCGIFVALWGWQLRELSYYVLGGCFFLYGAASVFGYFTNDLYRLAFQFDFAFGVLSAIIGVMFIVPFDTDIHSLFFFVLCVYVIADALLKIQTAIDARSFGMSRWVMLVISAAVLTVFGIVSLVLTMMGRAPEFLIGILVAADGAENMWNTAYTVRVRAIHRAGYEKGARR